VSSLELRAGAVVRGSRDQPEEQRGNVRRPDIAAAAATTTAAVSSMSMPAGGATISTA
jgi:hypothetical protein